MELGRKLNTLTLRLVRGEGFQSTITSNIDWPGELVLRFDDREWSANIDGRTATFYANSAQTEGLKSRDRVELVLDGYVWARGVVVMS